MWHAGQPPGCLLLLPSSPVMSNGQMQQSWPEKGMVTRRSDPSAMRLYVLPLCGPLRPAQVVFEREGNRESRNAAEEGDEYQCLNPDSST